MRKSKNYTKQASSSKKTKGSIRIIAGKHRGRKLPVLTAEGLRPTTDRVKETLFNWLMPYINQSKCLDCFAGAGSLGFEAQSRHAEHVTLVELDKQAAQQLKQNQQLLSADNITIIHQNLLDYLAQPASQTFDIVFIDPPFRQGLVEQTIKQLQQGWLSQQAIVYLEMESESAPLNLPSNWSLLKEKTAGQVSYRLYQLTQA
ncbi:16S rRNA (guanine(966)-N(2))-methyltransferase RsmD [Thalassotalea sp. G2M2-11]|uniref:16S rRNA (guanine(966)-N(2))-methyltransferase RsmD n=1 Tax=Thalassotalea sp. G2M2-11 TaxID=2787627 RepID=UPI0019D19E2F|nr:16S rRNA (guanine(966)-N(2))-methyltransferase RsmD [Thalassotalea sp. G2M2-11]